MNDFIAEAQTLFDYTRTLRRDFHRNPELGFQELRTAGIVARELNSLGLEVASGIGKTGVVALMEGARPGPTVLVRFDMDALPIQEETGAEYASQKPGVMHACGHDGHVAIGLTVARLLAARRPELAGSIKFVFQPAEEGLGGAAAMVADGVLENPRPDFSLALHLWNEKPFGWLGITAGPAMAASDRFQMVVSGRGGHGASPHLAADPILASAQIVTALQSIVARNVPPLKSAVVTVTSVVGGEAFNVIPATVMVKGTIRSFEAEIRAHVLERLEQVAGGVATALGCRADVQTWKITPPVVNHAGLTARVQNVAGQLLPGCTLDEEERTMGSEDMAYLMEDIPGCYFFVGSADSGHGLDAPHHNPHFDFDEQALPRSAALMAAATLDLLG